VILAISYAPLPQRREVALRGQPLQPRDSVRRAAWTRGQRRAAKLREERRRAWQKSIGWA